MSLQEIDSGSEICVPPAEKGGPYPRVVLVRNGNGRWRGTTINAGRAAQECMRKRLSTLFDVSSDVEVNSTKITSENEQNTHDWCGLLDAITVNRDGWRVVVARIDQNGNPSVIDTGLKKDGNQKPEDREYVIKEGEFTVTLTFATGCTATLNVWDETPAGELNPLYCDLKMFRNVILEGVAGCGKTRAVEEVVRCFEGRAKLVVFHASSSYEDFVEGLRPKEDGGFEVRDGSFLAFLKLAAGVVGNSAGEDASNSAGKDAPEWLFVIDEINRADCAKVLGDLLYAIEPSKRASVDFAKKVLGSVDQAPARKDDEPVPVELLLERTPGSSDGENPDNASTKYHQRLVVPDNVYILGTMNTTDRSVGSLDLALRRRFTVIRMEPMSADELSKITSDLGSDINHWSALNGYLKEHVSPDAMLGHSYFFEVAEVAARDISGVNVSETLWRRFLLPQLAEILVAFNAVDKLGELDTAVDRNTGGYWLKVFGEGIDRYPIVVERRGESTASTLSPGNGGGEDSGEPGTVNGSASVDTDAGIAVQGGLLAVDGPSGDQQDGV